MSNIDKQALNQEKIEWLNKLADMEYCKSNPGHWLMSLKDTNMLAKLALRSVALLDELEAAEKRIAELERSNHIKPCPKCNDTGMADSGGVQPWGEPIFIECDCRAAMLKAGNSPLTPDGWQLVPK